MDAFHMSDADKMDMSSDEHMDYYDPPHNPLPLLLVEGYWVERF
jgi:hypothetical protein